MVESERMSIPSKRRVSSIDLDTADPAAMHAVATASASMHVGAMTVALITSVVTGLPVLGDIVWPTVLSPAI